MKIWCDACNQSEATVFCFADEAALCQDCDVRVHQANKLASKHHRLSLLQPSSSSDLPHCDICQERKALLFCQQDRAVMCRDCDVSIHTANELTRKHSRFLLTGAKISLHSSKTTITQNMTQSGSAMVEHDPLPTESTIITHDVNNQPSSGEDGGYITSGISEYCSMEMLPEWQVEGLLDTSLDPVGFYKDSFDDDELLFLNDGFRVPQAPTLLQPSLFNFGVNEIQGTKGVVSKRVPRKMMDDGFTVPQISPQSIVSKRSRPIW